MSSTISSTYGLLMPGDAPAGFTPMSIAQAQSSMAKPEPTASGVFFGLPIICVLILNASQHPGSRHKPRRKWAPAVTKTAGSY